MTLQAAKAGLQGLQDPKDVEEFIGVALNDKIAQEYDKSDKTRKLLRLRKNALFKD